MKFFLFCFSLFAVFVSGCGTNLEELFYNNIAEIQREIYVGKFNNISATLIIGNRECEYIKNGYYTDIIDFAVLMIEGVENAKNIEYTYSLFVDEKVYNGVMENNPFGGLIVDIGAVSTGDIMVVTIMGNNESTDIVLRSITADLSMGCDDAVGIVLENYKKNIGRLKEGRDFTAEAYIKLMGTLEVGSDDLCWCITIITRGGERFSYVVSARSGEVLSVQNSLT